MATRRTVLEVDVVSDASDAVKEFDQVASSASDMGDKVSRSVTEVEVSSRGLDSAADSADNLASKSSQATGGLGALASGFSLVGAEKYAGGLEAAAMATDFFSGVGDLGNLVLQSTAVQTAKNTALKAKDIVVTKAQTVATQGATLAQRALNLVMKANPIGLVIAAITILVGIFIVLYKRNERFREVVDRVMGAVRTFIGKVVDKVQDLIGWVGSKLPGAWQKMKSLVVGYIKLVTLPTRILISVVTSLVKWVAERIPSAWAKVRDVVSNVVGAVVGKVGAIITKAQQVVDKVRGGLSTVWSGLKSKAVSALDAVMTPITNIYNGFVDIIEKVKDLIGWIKDIKIPDITPGFSLPGIGKAGTPSRPSGGPQNVINLTINGPIDPMGTAKAIRDMLARYGYVLGDVQGVS